MRYLLLFLLFPFTELLACSNIAIANYGPHHSLEEVVDGFKAHMKKEGFEEEKDICYSIMDVNFDPTLIPQMLQTLKAQKPVLVLSLSTPVTQMAQHFFEDTPIIFAAITDPVASKLLPSRLLPGKNITGASDQQDVQGVISFIKEIIHPLKKIGFLYATSEDNDLALLHMLKDAALKENIAIEAIAIDHMSEIPLSMQRFKGKVEAIYVGTSGPIQPSLSMIASIAKSFKIPIFNADENDVRNHQVLGSFAVSFFHIGENAALLAARLLRKEDMSTLLPLYPQISDHNAVLSRPQLEYFAINIPVSSSITVIE